MIWSVVFNTAPPRVNHASVVIDAKIYSFGGYNSSCRMPEVIDVHVFDTVNLKWHPIPFHCKKNAPRGLYGHSAVAHGYKIYIWGGQDGYEMTDSIYCFNVGTMEWSIPETTGCVPAPSDGHSACVIGDYMYIFGGYEQERRMLRQDLYRVNLITFHWELVATDGEPPDKRDFHTSSVIGERMYIFGGRSCSIDDELGEEEYYLNKVVYFDTTTNTWVTPNCSGNIPCGRRSHSASVYKNEIYIIGGYESSLNSHFSDVNKFNPVTNVWTKLKVRGISPTPRRRHSTCVWGDQLFLFGGSSPIRPRFRMCEMFLSSPYDELVEYSDMYVMEFFASLKRLAQLVIVCEVWRFDLSGLPKVLSQEIKTLARSVSKCILQSG